MVRTKADGTRKAVAAKAPRKVLASSSRSSGASMMSPKSGKAAKYAGGNLYNPQPTPDWQKGIGMFMSPGKPSKENSGKENEAPTDEIEVMEIGESSGASGSSTACSSSSSSASASGPSASSTSSKSPQASPQSSPESSPKKKSPIEDYSDEDE